MKKNTTAEAAVKKIPRAEIRNDQEGTQIVGSPSMVKLTEPSREATPRIAIPHSKESSRGAKRKQKINAAEQICVGDLISLKYSAELCQVIKIEDAAIIAHPIIDLGTDEVYPPEKRVAVHLHECKKIPSPVMPCNWQQVKMTQAPAYAAESITSYELQRLRWDFMQRSTTRKAVDRQHERREAQGEVSPDAQKHQHEKLLKTIQLFEQMYQVWWELSDSDSTDDYTLAWWDVVGLAHASAMLDQARRSLYDTFRSVSGSIGLPGDLDDLPKQIASETSASSVADAAYANVLKFVADVKKLQRRAWLYSQTFYACANESEIMTPFDTVIENTLGKVAAWFYSPLEPRNIGPEELEGTELLAGTRDKLPARGNGSQRKVRDEELVPAGSPQTLLDPAEAVDANGKPIRPGDFVVGTKEVISCGFPAGGQVVGVAGESMLIRWFEADGTHRYEGMHCDRYILQQKKSS